jgi:hypothetical protein
VDNSHLDSHILRSIVLQLESTIKLSETLVAQHTIAKETISISEEQAKRLNVVSEMLVQLHSALKSVQKAQASLVISSIQSGATSHDVLLDAD